MIITTSMKEHKDKNTEKFNHSSSGFLANTEALRFS